LDNEFMSDVRRGANQVLAIIVLFTLALAAVAAYLTSSRETEDFAPNSPEGVVQSFLKDVIDGRNEDAAVYFSKTSTCDAVDIDRSWIPNTVRVNLTNTQIEGDRAYIDVTVDMNQDQLFGDMYTEKHRFRLAREVGNWKILGIPWPLYSCDEVNK
jgi:hypothetical protein